MTLGNNAAPTKNTSYQIVQGTFMWLRKSVEDNPYAGRPSMIKPIKILKK